jgi:hypothetical protein
MPTQTDSLSPVISPNQDLIQPPFAFFDSMTQEEFEQWNTEWAYKIWRYLGVHEEFAQMLSKQIFGKELADFFYMDKWARTEILKLPGEYQPS